MTALSPPVPARGTPDEIDALSARPDFAILEFPGPLHAAEHVTADSPPLLLGAANDDACCSAPTVDLLQAYRQAGASAEIHLSAAAGHPFNLGEDTPLVRLQHLPQAVLAWLVATGFAGRAAHVFT